MSVKPPIPGALDPSFGERVREALLILMGRRNNRITQLYLNKRAFSATPTQAEVTALAVDVVETRQKLNEILELLHGPYS